MSATEVRFSFGPVPSRRLGRSVGINHIPAKTCSYACVYCQVGRTTSMLAERRFFFSAKEIAADVRDRVEQARRENAAIDFLTFVPDGEPTLDLNLGREIRLLRPLGIPIGVISNSTLIWREDVRRELAGADWVSLKIDAVREPAWRRINRPHRALSLEAILDGVLEFAKTFRGKLVSETMLLQAVDQDEEHVREIAEFLGRLQPAVAYLSVPTRPPAEKATRRPDEHSLNRAFQIIAAKVQAAELLIGYEGDAFASTGDIEKDLLAITAVHPMRREAIEKMLAKAGVSWSLVEALQARGDLAASQYEGNEYYLRSFHQRKKAGAEQPSTASPSRPQGGK